MARVLLRQRHGIIATKLRMAADLLLGIGPILLGLVLCGEVILLITTYKSSHLIAINVLGAAALISAWGLSKAWQPKLVTVPLSSPKVKKTVQFAQISDVHIGSRSPRFLRQVMNRIKLMDIDFLCITGDLIDQVGITTEQLESLGTFNKPIYFCIGNHERYEDLENIIRRLKSLGVNVLRNQTITAEGIQFIGIDDSADANQVALELPNINVLKDHYSILLYHRPQGLEAANKYGIDLKLSGHTHNGQIKPFDLAVKRIFKYHKGLYNHGSTTLYVNQGTGTWGPTMRLGTFCEITLFKLN